MFVDGSAGRDDEGEGPGEASGAAPAPDPVRVREGRIGEICGHLNVLHAELVGLVREALADGSWSGVGLRSPAQWLAWRTGLSLGRAREIVRMARRFDELPVTMGAFGRGELAVDQVAVIARRVPAWGDEAMADYAHAMTVEQLRVTARGFAPEDAKPDPATDPDPEPDPTEEPAPEVKPEGRCWFGFDDDGVFRLSASGGADGATVIETALREARDRLFDACAGTKEINWWDALVDVCGRSLDAVTSASRRGRYRVYVHLNAETGVMTPQLGPAFQSWVRDMILCDASLVPVWERDGTPVNVGRTRREPSDHVRRLVMRRDGGCRRPGCASTVGLDVHHIRWVEHGGPTDIANLATLCSLDHAAVHRGELSIEGDATITPGRPGSLVFRNRHGRIIAGSGTPTPPTGPPPDPEVPYEHPIGERLYQKWVTIPEPPDEPPDGPDIEGSGADPSESDGRDPPNTS